MTSLHFIVFFSIFLSVYGEEYADDTPANGEIVAYDGFKVYTLRPRVISQQFALEILLQNSTFDFWIKRNLLDEEWTVMVPPEVRRDFQNYVRKYNITHREIVMDVGKEIKQNEAQEPIVVLGEISFRQYESTNTIYVYLKHLVDKHPHVSLLILGESWNKKEILGIKIGNNAKQNNPGILIASGLNAREWIGPAGALYVIDQLANNPGHSKLYENVDWFIIPLLNPDGYEYARTTDRMWQKNLSPKQKLCDGVDLTRNFGFHWGESGSLSYDECDDEYIGTRAFTEPESTTLHRFMTTLGANIKLYLSLRAFGPMILYPWTYSSRAPNDAEDLRTVAQEAADAILKEERTKYRVDSYATAMYATGGTDIDWMKGSTNVSLVYSFNMPGRGSKMFDPMESEIKDVVYEMFIGMKVFHQHVQDKWGGF